MVNTTKKSFAKSLTADMRRSAQRVVEQMRKALITEEEALKRQARLESPDRKRKYAADMAIVDKLDVGFRGEIGYKILGNNRLRVDNHKELTREHGRLRKTKTVLKRNPVTQEVYLGLYERKSWLSVSSHLYAADGTLRMKHVKYKDGRFEEKWERDENGDLIRTRYANRGRLFQPVSEKMGAPYRSGPDDRLYRDLTRRNGFRRETFERDDHGNLERIGSNHVGFSKISVKAPNRQTSQTKIQKLGGAFNKSFRSLLDKEGNEMGRDILSHRRLYNKRSAVYDEATGQLKSAKHTFGKIYRSETEYLSAGLKKVSKKILGVTVYRKFAALSERRSEAERLRSFESGAHRQIWQERAAIPGSPLPETDDIHFAQQSHLAKANPDHVEADVTRVTDQHVDVAGQTSSSPQRNLEGWLDSQSRYKPANMLLSNPDLQANGPRPYEGLAHLTLRRDNESDGHKENDQRLRHFSQPEPLVLPHPGSPEITKVFGSRGEPAHPSGNLHTAVGETACEGPVMSSSSDNHQPAPGQQELLSFLHNAPAPVSVAIHDDQERLAGEAPGGSFRGSSGRTSSMSESIFDEDVQGHLVRDYSINTTNGFIDPQSLFGEPDLSRGPKSGPEIPSEDYHLSASEQENLLNQLLSVPLPVPSPKPECARSMIFEGSRSRERSTSRGF